MLWIKALHIVFVVAWFAGLFYLPRIFVNLAMETHEDATARLLLMGKKLFRFTTLLAIPALVFGLVLFDGYGVALGGPGNRWIYVKLFFVVLVMGYHHACWTMLKKFARGANEHGPVFYRWFNEVPVLLLLAIVILVVVKPF